MGRDTHRRRRHCWEPGAAEGNEPSYPHRPDCKDGGDLGCDNVHEQSKGQLCDRCGMARRRGRDFADAYWIELLTKILHTLVV
jgi:hypothetical protein